MLEHGDYVYILGGGTEAYKVVAAKHTPDKLEVIGTNLVVDREGNRPDTGIKKVVKATPINTTALRTLLGKPLGRVPNADSELLAKLADGSRVICYVADTQQGLSKKHAVAIIVSHFDNQFIDNVGIRWQYAAQINVE